MVSCHASKKFQKLYWRMPHLCPRCLDCRAASCHCGACDHPYRFGQNWNGGKVGFGGPPPSTSRPDEEFIRSIKHHNWRPQYEGLDKFIEEFRKININASIKISVGRWKFYQLMWLILYFPCMRESSIQLEYTYATIVALYRRSTRRLVK